MRIARRTQRQSLHTAHAYGIRYAPDAALIFVMILKGLLHYSCHMMLKGQITGRIVWKKQLFMRCCLVLGTVHEPFSRIIRLGGLDLLWYLGLDRSKRELVAL